jgi:hypothetical protein
MVLYLTIGLPVLCIIALKGSTVVVSLYALELGAGPAGAALNRPNQRNPMALSDRTNARNAHDILAEAVA